MGGGTAGDTAIFLLFLLLGHVTCTSGTSERLASYAFQTFNDTLRVSTLAVVGDATMSQGALQLTPDTHNTESFLVNKSGRVLLTKPFTLWSQSHDENLGPVTNTTTAVIRLASFNTSFTVNIFRLNGTVPGEGFAFILASSTDPPPPGSDGGFLGLTNAESDGMPTNHIVAVEFDTVKQAHDPDDNHVGLDINSVVSNVTASLTPFNITIAPESPANYTIWITYDGYARWISVYMALQGRRKPASPTLDAPLDLSKYILPTSYFGFAASTGVAYELNCILAWNLTVELLPIGTKRMARWKLGLAVALPVAVVAASALGFVTALYMKRRRRVHGDDDRSVLEGKLKSLPGMPREFKFKELKLATNNFDEKNKLGQGGFGVVYKGIIPGEGVEVAVKKCTRNNTRCQFDFLAELSIINRLRHKHLVKLVGWCHKKGVLLLVYDYMPNGSLDHHLYVGAGKTPLSWDRRRTILIGLSSALHYLHNEYEQTVVHRDLKAPNVLLDAAFNARLGDFGLARALDAGRTSYAEIELDGVPGTLGYIAPECFHTGKATRESDVFGLGAVVLEVVCGRRPRCDIEGFKFLVDWVWCLHRDGRILDAVDRRIAKDYDVNDARQLLLLGLACSHPNPRERPKMEAVVQIVSGSVPPPDVPAFRPSFVWPSAQPFDDDGASTSASTTPTRSSSRYYASSSVVWSPRLDSVEAVKGTHVYTK